MLFVFQDCTHLQKSCPCQNDKEFCPCGVGGTCTRDFCSSQECTRIHLTECKCPYLENEYHCHTCCLFENECLDSVLVTEKMLSKNKTLLNELFKKNRSTKPVFTFYGHFQDFYHEKNKFYLFFRRVPEDSFCLLHGEIGFCKRGNVCFVNRRKIIYPNLKGIIPDNESSKLIADFQLFYLCIFVNYFGNIF